MVDKAWYEAQYATPGARYHGIYKEAAPAWAQEANLYHVRLVLAWVGDISSVLELGAGVGRYYAAWVAATITHYRGVELAQSAVDQARLRCITQADATSRLPFNDDEFDLVFSAAFMEHIARGEDTAKVLLEANRLAPKQAHIIPCTDDGNDPSHVQIQSPTEWLICMRDALGKRPWIYSILNVLTPSQPLFLIFRDATHVPWTVRMAALEGSHVLVSEGRGMLRSE